MKPPLTKGLLVVTVVLGLAACRDDDAKAVEADLTIYVAGPLLEKGGAVVVSPLPVPPETWRDVRATDNTSIPPPIDLKPIAESGKRFTVVVEDRFADIQFLYPKGATYSYRFRPLAEEGHKAQPDALQTQVLSVGGTDVDGAGQEMPFGFVGLRTSGDRQIRVVGPDTGERAARVLAGLRDAPGAEPLVCTRRSATSVCTYASTLWPAVDAKWQKGKADLDREYRRMKALDDCQRAAERAGRSRSRCDLVSKEGEEARYEYRDK